MPDFIPSIKIFHIIALLLAVYAIISFWLLPRLRSKFAIGSSPEQLLALAGIYGFWSFIRSFAVIGLAACSVVCLYLIFLVVNYGYIESIDIKEAKVFFTAIDEIISFTRSIWFLVATILLVTGMAILSRRQMKQGIEKKIALIINRRRKELINQIDDWKHLPPTKEMSETLSAIQAADEYRQEIESSSTPDDIGSGEKHKLIAEIETKLGELTALYQYQDIERRIDFSDLKFDALLDDEPIRKGFFAFFSRLLTDRFTIETIGLGSRVIIGIGLLLAMLSTLGVATGTVNGIAIEKLSAWIIALNSQPGGINNLKAEAEAANNTENPEKEIEVDLQQLNNDVDTIIEAEFACDNANNTDEDTCYYTRVRMLYQDIQTKYDLLKLDIDAESTKLPRPSLLGGNLPTDISSNEFKAYQESLKKRVESIHSLKTRNDRLIRKLDEAKISSETFTRNSENLQTQIKEKATSIKKPRDRVIRFSIGKAETVIKGREHFIEILENNANKYGDSIIGQKSTAAAKLLHKKTNSESEILEKIDKLKNKLSSRNKEISNLEAKLSKYVRTEITASIRKMTSENKTTESRINQKLNPNIDQTVNKKYEALASQYYNQVFEPTFTKAGSAKLFDGMLKFLKKGFTDATTQDILNRHQKQKPGGYVPDSYTRRAELPNDLKTLINVAAKVSKDSQVSFRETVIGFITEILIGMNANDREAFSRNIDQSPPLKNTSFMGNFIKTIASIALNEVMDIPIFGPTLIDAANEVATSLRSGKINQAFDPSMITTLFSKRTDNFDSIDESAKNTTTVDAIKQYPPTFENLPPTEKQATEISKSYEAFLSDIENKVKKTITSMEDFVINNTSATEGFDHIFPGQDPPPTDSGPTTTPSGPKKPSGGGNRSITQSIVNRYALPANANTSHPFTRARSYTRLRGFNRIGGVLIGRAPKGDNNLDIIDLNWEWNGEKSKIRLKLQDASGKWHMSRWHDPFTVDLAMAYAADGRPITVTMTTAHPLPELRINLHPTLVDTELGDQAIELDRFVEKYNQTLYKQAKSYAESLGQLYRLGHAMRLSSLKDFLLKKAVVNPQHLPYIENVFSSWENEFKSANDIISNFEHHFNDRNFSKLKKTYDKYSQGNHLLNNEFHFDKYLSIEVKKAITNSKGLVDFKEKLSSFFNDFMWGEASYILSRSASSEEELEILNNLRDFKRSNLGKRFKGSDLEIKKHFGFEMSFKKLENHLKFLKETPPRFEIWSGVREKAYDLSIESILLESESDFLNFMMQVSFLSKPMISNSGQGRGLAKSIEEIKSQKEQRLLDAEKEEPWEFPGASQEIHLKTMEILNKNQFSDDAITFKKLSDFVQLQRLFRSAFSGRLGDSFPLQQVVALDTQLAENLKYPEHPTLRFNTLGTCYTLNITLGNFKKNWESILSKKEKFSFSTSKELKKIEIALNKEIQSYNTSTLNCKSTLESFHAALKEALDLIESVSNANKNSDQLLQIALLIKKTIFSKKLRKMLVIEDNIKKSLH